MLEVHVTLCYYSSCIPEQYKYMYFSVPCHATDTGDKCQPDGLLVSNSKLPPTQPTLSPLTSNISSLFHNKFKQAGYENQETHHFQNGLLIENQILPRHIHT